MIQRRWKWLIGAVAGLIILVVAVAFFIDEPLRRHVEQEMNSQLQGYTVQIGRLDLHPWRFAVTLYDVTIVQDANPDPPIVSVPRTASGVHWRALLSGRIVSDVLVERPNVHINIAQIREEAADDVPVQDRGWQEAIQAVTPLKLNALQVVDGTVTYLDEAPSQPLHISQLQLRAGNIRNVRSEEGVYPSDIALEGIVFESGALSVNGHADFLAVPHPAVKAQFTLEDMELGYFRPIVSRQNVALLGGTVSAMGEIEYAPTIQVVHLQSIAIHRVQMDYIYTAQTASAMQQTAQQAKEKVQEVTDDPEMFIRADHVQLVEGNLGFVNEAAQPTYRLFLDPVEVQLTNISNQRTEGTAAARVTGKFMGSGRTVVGATFRPETNGVNFLLAASIENTQMRTMNDLLRAHAKLDVGHGLFSVYSELSVQEGFVSGYVKPLFRDLDIYDPRRDREKGLFQQLYEAVVDGMASVLENVPRDEVATTAEISGPLEDPQASTWQVLVRLIQNAFFEAILPGFEGELGRSSR